MTIDLNESVPKAANSIFMKATGLSSDEVFSLATFAFALPFFFFDLDFFFCLGPWPSFPPPLAQHDSIACPGFLQSAHICCALPFFEGDPTNTCSSWAGDPIFLLSY